MTWKTRNIRRNSKGKKTKHRGGLFSSPSITDVIKYLVLNPQDIPVNINKGKVQTKYTIKFITDKKFTISGGDDNAEYGYKIKKAMMGDTIIIENTPTTRKAEFADSQIVIDKDTLKTLNGVVATSIKQSKTDKKTEEANAVKVKTDALAEMQQSNTENATEADNLKQYEVTTINLNTLMGDAPVIEYANHKYSEHQLNFLYQCIDEWLKQPVDKEKVLVFIHKFEQYNKEVANTDSTLDIEKAKLQIQFAIDVISKFSLKNLNLYISEKKKLTVILSKLGATDIVHVSKYSLDGEECNDNSDICFFVKCIKYYGLGDEFIDSSHLKIEDMITGGPNNGYLFLSYVSNKKDIKTYVGCVFYTVDYQGAFNYNISKILINTGIDEAYKMYDPTISKLYDIFIPHLNGSMQNQVLHIPSVLDDKVNTQIYEKEPVEKDDGFTTWKPKQFTNTVAEPIIAEPINNTVAEPIIAEPINTSLKHVELNIEEEKVRQPVILNDKEEKIKTEIVGLIDTITNMFAIPTTELPIEPPVVVPTTELPIEPPVVVPTTESPIEPPVVVPTTESPIEPPVVVPTTEPVVVQTESPIEPPVVVPTTEPVVVPTKSPVVVQTGGSKEDITTLIDSIKDDNNKLDLKTTLNTLIQSIPENILNDENFKTKFKNMVESINNNTTVIYKPDEIKTAIDTINADIADNILEETTANQMETTEAEAKPETTTEAESKPETTTEAESKPEPEVAIIPETTTEAEAKPEPEVANPITMESLKVSPSMTHPSTNEAGKYIFVPISKVDEVIELLLGGGCEVYTIPVK